MSYTMQLTKPLFRLFAQLYSMRLQDGKCQRRLIWKSGWAWGTTGCTDYLLYYECFLAFPIILPKILPQNADCQQIHKEELSAINLNRIKYLRTCLFRNVKWDFLRSLLKTVMYQLPKNDLKIDSLVFQKTLQIIQCQLYCSVLRGRKLVFQIEIVAPELQKCL